MPRIPVTRSAPLLAIGLAAPAFAQSHHVTDIIYVNVAGHPLNVVPGLGLPFKAGVTTTDGSAAFERPFVSGNGLHFGINALAAVGGAVTTSNDDLMIVDGVVALREGDVCPWPAGTETVGGTACAHLAFQDTGVDWELWLPLEGDPLPKRFKVVQKRRTGQPVVDVTFNQWDMAPSLPDETFKPKVPADYEGVAILQRAAAIKSTATAEPAASAPTK